MPTVPPQPEPGAIAMRMCLPVADLPPGEILPPFELDHPSHRILAEWDDPLAPRNGYRVTSAKTRTADEFGPALEWHAGDDFDRALVTGSPTWRDYSISCSVLPIQTAAGPAFDDPRVRFAAAGIIFRVETSRRYYFLCVEEAKRLVLYRRSDDDWSVLDSREITLPAGPVTLAVDANGDEFHASCPEAAVRFSVSDGAIASGRCGFRARGQCRLYNLTIDMSPEQRRCNEARANSAAAALEARMRAVPVERLLRVLRLPEGASVLACSEFHRVGVNDLLLACPGRLCAMSLEGVMLWELKADVAGAYATIGGAPGAALIFALTGRREGQDVRSVRGAPVRSQIADRITVVDGQTGKVQAEADLPRDVPHPSHMFDLSFEAGRLTGNEPTDILVRQDTSAGARPLWAFDRHLRPLWQQDVFPPYGHHNAVHFCDLDGDGRDEVLAGGVMLSSSGEVLWTHDAAEEMRSIRGARHYDAALVGRFAGPDQPPVVFLMGGSAGVYVVDAFTGRTRAVHRVGHAQWGMPCSVRSDLPGEQVMVGTRWGNYGILTLFSGDGKRLWSIQPDYILQGACPVRWTPAGPQLIWINTTHHAFGLYDGYGQMVSPLTSMRELCRQHPREQVVGLRLSPGPGWSDLLALRYGDNLHVFGREQG